MDKINVSCSGTYIIRVFAILHVHSCYSGIRTYGAMLLVVYAGLLCCYLKLLEIQRTDEFWPLTDTQTTMYVCLCRPHNVHT